MLEATPLPELLRELAERDPVTYEKIDRQNPRRVIRAVEVIRLTGKPFSAQRADWQPAPRRLTPRHCIGLARSPADLAPAHRGPGGRDVPPGLGGRDRTPVAARPGQNRTAMQALGYRQMVEHLRGERSLPETIELVKIRTRQFAKRQMTWFRRQLPLRWISLEPQSSAEAVAERIAGL